jgi:hypothetical protein
MEVRFNTEALKRLDQFFKAMTDQQQLRIYRAALTKVAKPMVMMARDLAPFKTGKLFYSIDTWPGPKDKISIFYGMKTGGIYGGWYGHFQEKGFKTRKSKMADIDKNAMQIKYFATKKQKVEGVHFLENAYNWNIDNVYYNLGTEVNRAVYRRMKRIIKK